MMNPTEQKWFNELTVERRQIVTVLKKAGLIDVFVSHIVDTYRESAHFIYELLQNADDAKATNVRFELRDDGLVFAHNGSVNFSISNPVQERNLGVVPGHVNAITTFSLSPKREDIENKIGKFGIGFKSVFQYTDSPHIYNPPYCFKIENYMIPQQVDLNTTYLKAEETTAFWLPFNKSDKSSTEAYHEIFNKLKDLKNPLLFLRFLTSIVVQTGSITIQFSKSDTEIRTSLLPDIELHKVILDSDTILRFDNKANIADKNGVFHRLQISIGFVLEGNKISAFKKHEHYYQHAWCFFPTKQPTNLNYIINAPFILTPNREALKEDRVENSRLITALGNLMESSLQALKSLGYITEDFFTTIPIPSKLPLIFKPIGEKLIGKLKNGEFIPTRDGKHISVSNAYVCTETLLRELLNFDKGLPLRRLTKKPNAELVFPERTLFTDSNLYVFFYKELSAAQAELNANWLGGQYTVPFINGMPEAFQIMFFKYLAERSNSILAKGQPLWLKPFIPVNNGLDEVTVVKPNNANGEPQVFIGGAKMNGRYIVVDYISNPPEIRNFLLTTLKFRVPNVFDDFLHNLGKYQEDNQEVSQQEIISDNLEIKRLLKELPSILKEKLIKKLKEINFLPAVNCSGKPSLTNPFTKVVYLPDPNIKQYFSKSEEDVFWVDAQLLGINTNLEEFKQFVEELTIETIPYYNSKDNSLGGLSSFLFNISLSESIYLANVLHKRDCFDKIGELKKAQWIFDKDCKRKAANEIKHGDLHPQYPHFFNAIHIELGAIIETILEKYIGLNDSEREIMTIINNSEDELSPEEIKDALSKLIDEKKEKKKKERSNLSNVIENIEDVTYEIDTTTPEGLVNKWTDEALAKNEKKIQEETKSGTVIPLIPNSVDFWKEDENENLIELDNPGGYIVPPVIGKNYKDEKEGKKKRQMEKEIELETKRNKLLELANQFEPYSFGWFKTLLELEDNFTSEERVKRSPVRVIFNKVTLDPEGILILSETVYIPPTIEEIGDLSIQLVFGDDKKTIKGEVVSPKKQELFIKLSNPDQLKGINLEKVSHVIVEASSPDFILERLKTAFSRLNFEDTDNLKSKELLPKDLNFVFGPPGTGKTTYLSWLIGGKNSEPLTFAKKPMLPLMEQERKKVLVLTPTNKAADVLVQRILKNHIDSNDYPHWLIRFGQTKALENEAVFVGDRMLKSWIYNKCTLVTTIARFPYDYFKVDRSEEIDDWSIRDFNWDVIIFDEASMIHQSALLFVVFYSRQVNPNVEFYIGGDPFQIPPIIQFEYPYWSYLPEPAFDNDGKPIQDDNGTQMAWKQDGGNIYAFIGLMKDESFSNPVTEPHQFQIHNLTKQYRSIVPIGALFSHYRYGGKLMHHRTPEAITSNFQLSEKKFEIPGLPLKPITIVRFPVKKNEGVYRVRTINGSPYQLYSSIFSVELIKYIQANAILNKDDKYRIGIISPYAIQSNIIEKLLNTLVSGSIEVITGTVHSFQGDECNLVIVVLNPPKKITRSPRTFVNKKNILNVAISRAMDKMIILVPYDPDGELNIDDLHQIQWIKRLAQIRPECKNDVVFYDASEIEKKFLGGDKFIENNTFPTTHQNVNIYTKAVRLYEIRQDENAIDVQVHPTICK